MIYEMNYKLSWEPCKVFLEVTPMYWTGDYVT